MCISKGTGKKNLRGLCVSLWEMSQKVLGIALSDSGDPATASKFKYKASKYGKYSNRTLQIGEAWKKTFYICERSMRNKHSFRKVPSKLKFASGGNNMPTPLSNFHCS